MKAHIIKLQVRDGHVTPHPDPAKESFAIGDTISFVSDAGKPAVEFNEGHPFSAGKFKDGDPPVTIVKKGKFMFHCGVVLPNGETLGWPKDPKSGGGGET